MGRNGIDVRRGDQTLAMEALEPRCLLAADLAHLATGLPEVHMQLASEIMGRVQMQAEQLGLGAPVLLAVDSLQHPLDVNRDGYVSAMDALQVINRLNQRGGGDTADDDAIRLGRYDVNRDTVLSPIDALRIINGLNSGKFGQGRWWEQADGTQAIVADTTAYLCENWTNPDIQDLINSFDRVLAAVDRHVEQVAEELDRALLAAGNDQAREELVPHVRQVGTEIRSGLERLQAIVQRQAEYLSDQFYRDVIPEGESSLSPEKVDRVLNQLVDPEGEHDGADDDDDYGPRWHADYLRQLIDRHIDYIRQGIDPGQIGELIVSHAEYLSDLLEIHDIDRPDLARLGVILDHLHEVLEWLETADWEQEYDQWSEWANMPPAIRERYRELISNHVGYARELVDRHREMLEGDYDLADLVRSHLDAVRDILAVHGLPTWWYRNGGRRV